MSDLVLRVAGINHVTAPVDVREKIAFNKEQLPDALKALVGHIAQGLILSTCNRTEVYSVSPEKSGAAAGGKGLLFLVAQQRGLQESAIAPYCYVYSQRQAIQHLLRVVCGLDSMILGEEQIQSQVRYALMAAEHAGLGGRPLSNLFRHALRVGKRARSETGISRYPVSVSHAAVKLAKATCGDLGACPILVVSAGEMGKLTAKIVKDSGARQIRVTSRNYQKAANLALALGGIAEPFDRLPEALAESDIVISSTGAPGFIIGPVLIEEVMKKRKGRPLLIIDIAVPRDADPAIRRIEGVHLHDIDDLSTVSQGAMVERKKEAQNVTSIIGEEVEELERWWTAQKAVPTIVALREKSEAIRQRELRKTLARMPHLTEEEKGGIDILTRAITRKMLHSTILRLKDGMNNDTHLHLVRELFDLDTEDNP